MRLVAGRHRGRILKAPAGQVARPTADRTRESLFNILSHGRIDWDGATVLDGFAGSGALGFEALSRGAAFVTFIESHAASLAALRANADSLKEGANVAILRGDATRPPMAKAPADLVFLDPPYGQNLASPALTGLAAQGWMALGTVCVVEIGAEESLDLPAGFTLDDDRRYGAARVLFAVYASDAK